MLEFIAIINIIICLREGRRPFIPVAPSPLAPLPHYCGRGELLFMFIVEVNVLVHDVHQP